MKKIAQAAFVASSLATLLALGGCGDRIENTEMPEVAQPNVEINRQGLEGAKDENAAVGVEDRHADVGHVETLGASGDTSVMDPDVLIAEQVKAALAANPDYGTSKVDVHSSDGEVTLRGQAPDPQARERAGEIARSVNNVRSVDNQLTLG
jgi:osmotically-inducible protein OsmY